jgi:hypothetical protein
MPPFVYLQTDILHPHEDLIRVSIISIYDACVSCYITDHWNCNTLPSSCSYWHVFVQFACPDWKLVLPSLDPWHTVTRIDSVADFVVGLRQQMAQCRTGVGVADTNTEHHTVQCPLCTVRDKIVSNGSGTDTPVVPKTMDTRSTKLPYFDQVPLSPRIQIHRQIIIASYKERYYSVEIPTRFSFVIEFIIPKSFKGSTCFEQHTKATAGHHMGI